MVNFRHTSIATRRSHITNAPAKEKNMEDRRVSQRIPSTSRLTPRPAVSRKRSNSVPVFDHVYVSQAEASVLVNAAERATARRQRRPASVDTPGPVVRHDYSTEPLPNRAFNFSTPSRYGLDASHPKTAVSNTAASARHTTADSQASVYSEDEDEVTPTDTNKPLPPSPPQKIPAARPIVVVRPPSELGLLPSPPFSPRRQVANETLKAYADGLFSFTQNRLKTAAPQNLKALGLTQDIYEETPPPTPELDQEDNNEIAEMSYRPGLLRSQFSDWSATTADTDDEDGYLSSQPSTTPQTPDGESDILSPDSFFNMDSTPRVTQRTEWAALSSARPSSNVDVLPYDSPSRVNPNSLAEPFSYFADFDSVTAAAETQTALPHDASQAPYYTTAPAQPSMSVTSSMPYHRHDSLTPLEEPVSLSRPPSWLIKAIS